ncbi:MAG: helicase-related protein [Pseudomonadota bacterium]
MAISTSQDEQKALQKLIDNYSKKYKKLMVACGSIDTLTQLARIIKNIRKKSNEAISDNALDNDFKMFNQLVYNGLVTRKEGKNLLELAEQHIFVHHAQLPLKLREWMEMRFKENQSGEVSEILFTTETLFYGVNLPADCVILTDINWVRENFEEGTFDHKKLTPNEYHNILGRAGRPGYDYHDKKPIAVVCFSTKDFEVRSSVEEQILYYYKNKKIKRFSNVLLKSDLENASREAIEELDQVTHPTFRSVMDALRHLGVLRSRDSSEKKYVSENKVIDLFKDTIFFSVGQYKQEVAKQLIKSVLEVAANYGNDNLSLVERSPENPNKYKMTKQAEALIDTGTHLQDILPMLKWLNKIKELKTAIPNQPVELLIPAFISSHNLWITARQFCKENKWGVRNPSAEQVDKNNEVVKNILLKELEKLQPKIGEPEAKLIEEQLSEYVAELNLTTEFSEFKKAIFYRLVTAFLRWLRGEKPESIQELSLMTEDVNKNRDEKPFLNRYAEKASWLSVMCLRFFADTGNLQLKHLKELPHLSMRLRYGITSEGLPFSRNIYFEKLFRSCVENSNADRIKGGIRKITTTNINKLTDILVKVLKARQNFDITNRLNTIEIKLADNNILSFNILVPEGETPMEKTYDNEYLIIIRLPWRNEELLDQRYIELTACGGMVLTVLFAREFLNPNLFINKMNTFGIRTLSIKDIVEEFEMPNLHSSVRETLLKFNEPGIE